VERKHPGIAGSQSFAIQRKVGTHICGNLGKIKMRYPGEAKLEEIQTYFASMIDLPFVSYIPPLFGRRWFGYYFSFRE
jgi:hypothetical protein